MRVAIVFFCAAAALGGLAPSSDAQVSPAPSRIPPSADTTYEPLYPVGDATPVYRAVLDLIYLDGSKRPSVIIMLDSADGRYTGGPCPIAKCIGYSWPHQSKIDASTMLAFAHMGAKGSRLVQFGYPIPIVYISYDDVNRMEADGHEWIASHPVPVDLPARHSGLWAELNRKYPGAWGLTTLSKVGFNERHTEALVQARELCGDDCHVNETLFLRQTDGRWRVVERIPEEPAFVNSAFSRYLGPAGGTPKESEIVPVDRPGVPTEATARDDVYRTVLDSLYSVNGERPTRIVLTNWFYLPPQLNAHTSRIDSALVRKFSFLARFRAPFDAISEYRVPIATLPVDSIPALRGHGLEMDQTGFFWPAFAAKYPGAWGMLGVGRIAFNSNRSRALVSTSHACGAFCRNLDTWFLTRSGKSWRIAERIPGEKESTMDVEGLRYLGADVSPVAYRPHRVQGTVSDEATKKPIPFLDIIFRRTLVTSGKSTNASVRTDKAGHYAFADLPLSTMMTLIVPCPGQQRAMQVQPIAVTPGMDTTVNTTVDFAICDTTAVVQAPPPPPAPNPLSGAQAFIGADSARFEFPRQSNDIYLWDLPMKGAYSGSPEYMWWVDWQIADSLAGEAPRSLWLMKGWKAGGPRKGSLEQLVSGARLEPMIECRTCDQPAVFEDPDTDHTKVFARVENNRLVFVIRGADAVRHVFRGTPTTVTFTRMFREVNGPSQEVVVNCHNSNESAEAKHRCDVKH